MSLWGFASGEAKLGWDDSALDGAGMSGLDYKAISYFDGSHRFKSALDAIPYKNQQGRTELLILGREGDLWSVPESGVQGKLQEHFVMNIKPHFLNKDEGKPVYKRFQLLSGILDRDWPSRPFLYLAVHGQGVNGGRCMIVRYSVNMESGMKLNGEPEVLFGWETVNHNGCDLQWGPKDGYLYFSAGDGSVQRDPNKVGQQVHVVRGSILRIDVHSQPKSGNTYVVPAENPFVGMKDVLPEIWAYGLRNPWRTCFHPITNELWVADNGDEQWEMLHCVKRGSNAGWSTFEGFHPFNRDLPLGGPTRTHTVPRLAQSHAEVRSIIGGVFYRGKKFPELLGHYVYGCYVTREIWAVAYDSQKDQLGSPFRIAKVSQGTLTAVREDHRGELLLISLVGTIETLKRREQKQSFRPWPMTLSETGLFENTVDQKPAAGVLEYDVQAKGWADGASSRRFVALPNRPLANHGGIRFRSSLWVDPGGALVKTLYMAGKPVETQVLYNSGTWQGYTYKWDSEGKKTSLVQEEGETVQLRGVDGKEQTWRYPSRSECMICHNQRSLFGIAFTTPQLNKKDSKGPSQMDDWLKMKILRNNRDLKKRQAVKFPDPYDPDSGTLEERARAYLHVNCAHCHYKTGMGGRSTLELEYHTPLSETGMINGTPLVGLLGEPDTKLVLPGQAEKSELLARMNRRGAGQMPLFGSHKIDDAGVNLIREWINSLVSDKQ